MSPSADKRSTAPSAASQVKSATRALEVLELFKTSRRPLAMTDIAHELGYPASSTTVLLKTLMGLGYLSFDRLEKRYFPTPKLTSLGDWVPNALFGRGRALEALRAVHAATGESVSLSTANDVYVQYIQLIQSVHPLHFHVDEGALRPLTRSANGWLLMSVLTDAQIDNVVRRANIAAANPAERVTVADMMARIHAIRRDGYAVAEDIPFAQGGSLGILLPTTLRGKPVVLGLGGARERMRENRERYLDVLRRAAALTAGPDEAPNLAGPSGM